MRNAIISVLATCLPAVAFADTTAAPVAPPTTTAAADIEIDDPPPPASPTASDAPPDITKTVPAPVHADHRKWLEPYGAIAGGMELESLHQPASSSIATQNPTVAISRLGLRGGVGPHVTFASSFEASLGGPLGYGASVWEGQASLAVLDQWVRYARDGFAITAGRVADPASFDYVSAHVGDLLLADLYTRDPLLYSGADRGNGIFATYELGPHVTAGLTFHSTNPTGITGTLIIGGKLQPFDRPFYLAAAQVGLSQDNLPDQNLHIYFGSPSISVHTDRFEVRGEVQMYSLDTQVAVMTDQPIRGYNLRLSARGKLDAPIGTGTIVPFANVSRNENEILDSTDSLYRLPDLFHSYTVSGGVDWNIRGHDGIGVQYAMVDTREPGEHERDHYLNLGTTYWVEDSFAVGVRAAVFAQQISGETMTTGERSLFVTARLVLE